MIGSSVRPAGLSPEMPWPITPGYYSIEGEKHWIAGPDATGHGFLAHRPSTLNGGYSPIWMGFPGDRTKTIRPWREPRTFTVVNVWFQDPNGDVRRAAFDSDEIADRMISEYAAAGIKAIARQTVTMREGEGV